MTAIRTTRHVSAFVSALLVAALAAAGCKETQEMSKAAEHAGQALIPEVGTKALYYTVTTEDGWKLGLCRWPSRSRNAPVVIVCQDIGMNAAPHGYIDLYFQLGDINNAVYCGPMHRFITFCAALH